MRSASCSPTRTTRPNRFCPKKNVATPAGFPLVGGVAVQGQDDVGAAVVGEVGALLVVPRAGEPRPGVDDVGSVRAEAALDASGEVVDDLRLDDPVGDGTGVVTAVTRVEDDGPPAQAVPGTAHVLTLAQGQRGPHRPRCAAGR
jgi:hypothetical protein